MTLHNERDALFLELIPCLASFLSLHDQACGNPMPPFLVLHSKHSRTMENHFQYTLTLELRMIDGGCGQDVGPSTCKRRIMTSSSRPFPSFLQSSLSLVYFLPPTTQAPSTLIAGGRDVAKHGRRRQRPLPRSPSSGEARSRDGRGEYTGATTTAAAVAFQDANRGGGSAS